MTPLQKRKLEKLLKTLEEGRALIVELLKVQNDPVDEIVPKAFDAQEFLRKIRESSRAEAEELLGSLKQHKLGTLFVECGGASSEKTKPRVWLIEQILWRVFDFDRGHDRIRNRGEG